MSKERFNIVRVVTKDIITDSFQGLRNFFGLRLRGYEKVLDKNLKEMTIEMDLKYQVEWYRIIVNPLTNRDVSNAKLAWSRYKSMHLCHFFIRMPLYDQIFYNIY